MQCRPALFLVHVGLESHALVAVSPSHRVFVSQLFFAHLINKIKNQQQQQQQQQQQKPSKCLDSLREHGNESSV